MNTKHCQKSELRGCEEDIEQSYHVEDCQVLLDERKLVLRGKCESQYEKDRAGIVAQELLIKMELHRHTILNLIEVAA